MEWAPPWARGARMAPAISPTSSSTWRAGSSNRRTGSRSATGVLVHQAHLVFSPQLPTVVLPLVAVAVPLVDTLIALPVLVAMLAGEGELHATILLLPAVLAPRGMPMPAAGVQAAEYLAEAALSCGASISAAAPRARSAAARPRGWRPAPPSSSTRRGAAPRAGRSAPRRPATPVRPPRGRGRRKR